MFQCGQNCSTFDLKCNFRLFSVMLISDRIKSLIFLFIWLFYAEVYNYCVFNHNKQTTACKSAIASLTFIIISRFVHMYH